MCELRHTHAPRKPSVRAAKRTCRALPPAVHPHGRGVRCIPAAPLCSTTSLVHVSRTPNSVLGMFLGLCELHRTHAPRVWGGRACVRRDTQNRDWPAADQYCAPGHGTNQRPAPSQTWRTCSRALPACSIAGDVRNGNGCLRGASWGILSWGL